MEQRKQFQISLVFEEIAEFFKANPKAYTSEYVALMRGNRTTYLNPEADQWDIIGRIGKTLWEKYGFRVDLATLWVFKRMSRAFKEANQVECDRLESPFFVFELYCSDSILDIIAALKKAAHYAKTNGLDDPLDLTPAPQYEEKPLRLYI